MYLFTSLNYSSFYYFFFLKLHILVSDHNCRFDKLVNGRHRDPCPGDPGTHHHHHQGPPHLSILPDQPYYVFNLFTISLAYPPRQPTSVLPLVSLTLNLILHSQAKCELLKHCEHRRLLCAAELFSDKRDVNLCRGLVQHFYKPHADSWYVGVTTCLG